MKTVKKLFSLILALLISVSVFSFFTGCGERSEDDEAIKEIVAKLQKSINEENLDDFIDCFHPDTIEPILSAINSAEELGYTKDETSADIFSRFSQDTQSVKFEVGAISYSESDTKASADVTLTASDTESATAKIDFIKSGDKWYIDGTNMI